jgi:hypothetical protein
MHGVAHGRIGLNPFLDGCTGVNDGGMGFSEGVGDLGKGCARKLAAEVHRDLLGQGSGMRAAVNHRKSEIFPDHAPDVVKGRRILFSCHGTPFAVLSCEQRRDATFEKGTAETVPDGSRRYCGKFLWPLISETSEHPALSICR